ncbi:MAG: bifunctional riboflavin kinase/FAD synthetase [Bacteroidales bacterium]|nr:bifunctional riboflavin kinase/FAD synthetase [Bacteroidales bacterium]
MQVIYDIEQIPSLTKPIVTVGIFDGVHCGHQEIFRQMKALATEPNQKTVAITFEPHPRIVLNNNQNDIRFINILEKKIERIALSGIDYLLIINFTPAFATLSPEDFIREYLVNKLRIGTLVIGYDHHFGKSRSGDYHEIERLGVEYGFAVVEVGEVCCDGDVVSSTRIREALKKGEIESANKYLGYRYSITGTVVHGNMLGRKMGFPTANIALSDRYKLITANGVYACYVLVDGKWYEGMGNIGFRPTIEKSSLTVEVHIFNFDEDIYGKTITAAFVKRIRDEIKFPDTEHLKQQLAQDKIMVQGCINGIKKQQIA